MKREQQQVAPRSTPERNDYNREQSRNNNRTKSIPCRFYKYDKCRRGEECLFLHYTCKDFQQGKCPYNDYCKFRHPTTKPTRPMYQNRQYWLEKEKKPTKEIKILYANARGLRSKLDSLQAAALLYEPDLIMLVETHIVGKSKINIRGYKETIVRNRKSNGGGLLIA